MASRGSFVSRSRTTKEKKRKPVCELGNNCPYIHQYQHSMEFSHGEDESQEQDDTTSRSGRVQSSTTAISSFQAFSGSGRSTSIPAPTTSRGNRPMQNSTSSLRTAAALAATRRASANSGENSARGSEQRGHEQDVPDTNNARNRNKATAKRDVNAGDKISESRTGNILSKKGNPPPKKKAKASTASNESADIIDLCDISDED